MGLIFNALHGYYFTILAAYKGKCTDAYDVYMWPQVSIYKKCY